LGRIRERLVGPELDHRPAGVPVAVEGMDVRRPGLVGLAGQCTCKVVVLDRGVEEDLLTRLHVRADANRKLGVALEAFVHRKDPMWIASIGSPGCASFEPVSGTGRRLIPTGTRSSRGGPSSFRHTESSWATISCCSTRCLFPTSCASVRPPSS